MKTNIAIKQDYNLLLLAQTVFGNIVTNAWIGVWVLDNEWFIENKNDVEDDLSTLAEIISDHYSSGDFWLEDEFYILEFINGKKAVFTCSEWAAIQAFDDFVVMEE